MYLLLAAIPLVMADLTRHVLLGAPFTADAIRPANPDLVQAQSKLVGRSESTPA